MSSPTTGQMPAGWYPDPSTPGQVRWWDSAAWTSDVQAAPQEPPPSPAPGPQAWLPGPSSAPQAPQPVYQSKGPSYQSKGPSYQSTGPSYQGAPDRGWQQTDVYRVGGYESADLAAGKNTSATAGLTLGIISLGFGGIVAILGLVFSIKGLGKSKQHARAGHGDIGRLKSVWGIAASSIGICLWVIIGIAIASHSFGTKISSHPTASPAVPVSRLTGTYSGTSLASDVTRALAASGLSANSVTCADTAQVDAGVITDCTAMLDGRLTAVRVTWTDAAGHFALTEKAP